MTGAKTERDPEMPLKPVLTIILVAGALAAGPATAQAAKPCPPGLAKKTPACVPPGQAKKWQVGDRFAERYDPIRDWRSYRLPQPADGQSWVRVGDVILKVDDDTRRVIEILDLVAGLID